MSFEALGELSEILNRFAARNDVSVIVLASALEKYFVSHADLDDLDRIISGKPVVGERAAWRTTPSLIEDNPQPVIAAVNGQAWGGGTELALACSMRVATPDATFGLPEIAVGMVPGAGGTQRLPRLIGSGRALELILSGRKVDAEEALRIGLVNAVLPQKNFVQGVVDWAKQFAVHDFEALVANKQAVTEGARLPFEEGLDLERSLVVSRTASSKSVELRAQLMKRYAAASPDDRIDF
jgi:enoyl-CoA hydratase/carnithine racemase